MITDICHAMIESHHKIQYDKQVIWRKITLNVVMPNGAKYINAFCTGLDNVRVSSQKGPICHA